ncbi:hypothetical protein NA56DRAFT_711141 [Hyaloscypha hepaticicola]|uniref:Uncharacterized protein n=1 Tax=Hyaloscypha hepaticicola TaxID=2082293 RepID=A0A2J6PJT8_9HELO|nr:hypothetical protein NA56DRAFT_711141 [Hyaloscypha hepaticicola]
MPLRGKTAQIKAELDSPQGSKHQTPDPPSEPQELVKATYPDPEILKIRAGLGIIRSRNTPEDRYISGSFQDLPRDPETEDDRSIWGESDGYMAKMPLYRGHEQAFILYYRSDQDKHSLPPFNKYPICMDSDVGLPFYKVKDEINWIPVNVRPDCATLGFAYLDLPHMDLSQLFPADIAADQIPFSDRLCWCTTCRPRALYKDFPLGNGKWGYDNRIAYILTKENEVIFLGGDGFDPTQISERDWANFHHRFINISDRDRKALKPVLQEEVESKRRASRNPLQPPGAMSTFDTAYRYIFDQIQRYRNSQTTFTEEDFDTVMNWIPTRGYKLTQPSFDLFQHAALSGSMYTAGFKALSARAASQYEVQGNIIRGLDEGINSVARAHSAHPENIEEFLADLGPHLRRIHNDLVGQFSVEQNLMATLQKVLDQIPEPLKILGGIPKLVFNDRDYGLATQVGRMITNIAPLKQDHHWALRQNWTVEVDTNLQGWHTEPEGLGSYEPFQFPNRSDSILRERLLGPTVTHQPVDSQKPKTPAQTSPQQELDEFTEGRQSILGKRKVSWDHDGSDASQTPTKKSTRRQVRPIIKSKAEPLKKQSARKSVYQSKNETEDSEVDPNPKPNRKTNKGDISKLPTPTVPGWKHAPKTGSSIEGKVWFYQPPESGSHINDHSLHFSEEARKLGRLIDKGTKKSEALPDQDDEAETSDTESTRTRPSM